MAGIRRTKDHEVLTRLAGCCRFKSALGRFCVFFFLVVFSLVCQADNTCEYNLAFYYGAKPPVNTLKFYKNIVLEPSSGVNPRGIETVKRKVFAYASLGEVVDRNQYAKPINKNWILAKNENWQSLVLDQSNPEWQAFFLNEVISPLWAKGYRGFFLDTLDSYRLASEDPEAMKKQQKGIVTTIRAIKAKYPQAQLIVNRGFEILPEIKSLVHEVVAESLFAGWDNQKKHYFEVSEKNREALLKELLVVKKMGIPVTVVDYVAPSEAFKAKGIAKKIADLGFNPWVTDAYLRQLYLFDVALLPRKILLFYQGKPHDVQEKVGSYISKSVTMSLNYMGYVTVLRNIAEPLPQDISPEEYAGVVVGIDGFLLGREEALYDWYKKLIQKKIPLVVLNGFGFPLENQKLKLFHLSTPVFKSEPQSVKIVYQAPMIGYEIAPIVAKDNFEALTLSRGTSLLKVSDEVGTLFDMAAITPWGGYFLTDVFLTPTPGYYYRWSINPFVFFKQALQLPDRPIPDTTSENGRRLMMVHIDGDGFANKGEWHKAGFVGDIMRKEFLERYPVPSTVSIIEGEIAPNGLHPELSPKLEQIARQIFALPNVEIASHTFSHPFNWQEALKFKDKEKNPALLPIPNYHFNLYREVYGSIEYINKNLAPPGKQAKVFLWSGEGNVPEKALAYAYQLGLANLNPGTLVTKYHSSLSRVSAFGVFEGAYFQAFAPIGNDNETIRQEPFFYSMINIIDALKLTDKPYRLKPIDIYVHFYSVAQLGGIKALRAIYDWALSQPVMNLYVSDFFNKLIDFNELLIAKRQDGWLFVTSDALRELRLPRSMGYPDLLGSTNVIGYSLYNDDCYVHLGPGGEAFVRITSKPSSLPFLWDANARVTHFIRKEKGIDLGLEGYLPLKMTFANMDACTLFVGKEQLAHQMQQGNQKYYELKKRVENELSIRCE